MKFELTENQVEKYMDWGKKHSKTCKLPPVCCGGTITFSFTPTGLGEGLEVKCACGEKIDLTDYDNL